MSVDPQAVRGRSLRVARALGYGVEPSLPLLDESVLRSGEEVQARALALHATVAAAFGFDRERVRGWLQANGLASRLSGAERAFLERPGGAAGERVKSRVEALYAFAWALSLASELDFSRPCPDDTVTLYPDLRQSEDTSAFHGRAQVRASGEIVEAADLAYCLHWSVRQAQLDGRPVPGRVDASVIEERRRALDWMLTDEEWDELTLDT